MHILVFDDNKFNCAAAQAQLGKHDLTVVNTYDEAQKLLTPCVDYEKVFITLENQFGGKFNPRSSNDETKYFAAKKVAIEQSTSYPNFDVVLSDLLVPTSGQKQSSMKLVGMEMPVGIFIGLLAAVKARVKYVAVFTDSSHHSHPASACFDAFNDDEDAPVPFVVEDSKVLFSNTRNWVEQFDPQDFSKALKYEEYSKRSDTVRAKNWAALLEYLTA